MENSESIFGKFGPVQWIVAGGLAVSILVQVVVWWFKPEPKKSPLLLIAESVLMVGMAVGIMYLIRPSDAEFDRMKREGKSASATVLQVESTNVLIGHRPQVRLRLRVEVPGNPAYETTRVDLVGLGQSVVPGRRLQVYVDRVDPQKMVIDWSQSTAPLAPAAGAETEPPNTGERLAALQRLRDQGHITDEEYQAQRQRILSEL